MKKLIKILFNISYIVSLSALVFLGGIINRVTDRGNSNKDGRTILGDNLSINHASADAPGDTTSSDGDCDGGDDDDDC